MKNDPAADQDLYDLAPPADAPPPPRVAPAIHAAPAAKPTLAYRSAPAASHPPDKTEALKNLYLPLWLLAGGVVIDVVGTWIEFRQFSLALSAVGLGLVAGTAVMLAGIFVAARFRGIDLGTFASALLKLAAITVAPGAVVLLCTPALNYIPFGFILGWVGEFVLYFALIGALFDLDESDTWYCVCVIFLIRLAVYFALLAAHVKLA